MNKVRYTIFIGALFLALFASALHTAPALADESTPTPAPEETTAEETNPQTEGQDEAQDPPPAQEETDSVSESDSQPVETILEQLPADTTLIVLDEDGEALPLATEEAEEAIALGDPRWCPVGVTPGAATCSPSFTKFIDDDPTPGVTNGLLEWLALNNPAKAGVIWIEASYDSSSNETAPGITDIVIDGTSLTNMANYALTINGGWAGGASTSLSTTDLSEFNVPFKVIGWNAPVTIKNITVNGASGSDYALEVGSTAGLITVTNVDVSNNTTILGGASLTNNLAVVPAGVTVNDSDFNSNDGNGLEVNTKGAVTLKNVNANDNADYGANINNTSAVTAMAVSVNGTNSFKYNGFDGLVVFSKGAITLNYITASYNGENGVYLDNCLQLVSGTGLCVNTFASAVTVKGYNYMSDNGWDGLRVFSNGVITVTNITANNNGTDPARDGDVNTDYDAFGKGVYLDNSGALTTKRGVIVSGTNFFNANESAGLFVISDGLITLNNITAHENQCDFGLEGNNFFCAGVYLYSNGGATQTGYANFVDNLEYGLRITTYNTSITLTTLYAVGNGKDGVHIDGGISTLPANVTINGSNIFNDNGEFGLWVLTNGSVTLNNITAKNNGDSGTYVDNTYAVAAKAVSIKGVNIFQGNDSTGLTVFSRGAITINSITSVDNFGQAVILDNCDYDGVDCDAYTTIVTKIVNGKTVKTTVYQSVSMTGTNFLANNANGLLINSRGSISIANLTSMYHSNDGASLKNDYLNAVGNVTLTGSSNLSNNGTDGAEINTRGAVTLASITANFNGLKGVEVLNNIEPLKPGNVTISGTNRFNNNGETGLAINSFGTVTLSNITASDNGNPDDANGVRIDNFTGTITAKAVVVNGSNYFDGNDGTGLFIISKGAVTVNKVTANNNNNGGDGVYIENQLTTSSQPVTISNYGVFLNNAGSGLEIISSGKVTVATLTANDNAVHGVDILTHYDAVATSAVDVVFTGINNFVNNTQNGLQIFNDGVITLSNIFASSNGNNGAYLNNTTLAGSAIKAIAVNGVNNFSNNGNHGLQFLASGAVTLTRVTADGNTDGGGVNTGSGIDGFTLKTITFTCGSASGNENFGFNFTGATAITLKGVYQGQTNFFGIAPVVTRACTLP